MLTPVDIENKEFRRGFRGYDEQEVDDFIREICRDYERLYRENAKLKETNETLNDSIGRYKTMEETMQNALMVAQHTAEDIKSGAYGKAENIIREAQLQADDAVNRANQAIGELANEYTRLYGEVDTFKARMGSLLSSYEALLKDIPRYEEIAIKRIPPINHENPATLPAKGAVEAAEAVSKALEDTLNGFRLERERMKQMETEAERITKPEPAAAAALSGFSVERPETGIPHEAKVNPVVEELLKQTEKTAAPAAGVSPASAPEPAAAPAATTPVPNGDEQQSTREMILNFDTSTGKNFDVFKEDPLD